MNGDAFRRWMDDTKRRLRRVETAVRQVAAVPVGGLILYDGAGVPDAGWLLANGGAFSDADYPLLADVLGGTNTPNIAGVGGAHYIIRAR